MIHLSVRSPFAGYKRAVLYGKGPSLHCQALWPSTYAHVGINEAALILPQGDCPRFGIFRDWTVGARIPHLDIPPGRHHRFVTWIAEQRVWARRGDCEWLHEDGNYYFDAHRVWGLKEPSPSCAGRYLGVGTATAALQLLHEAGVEEVVLNGFDSYFGGGLEYADTFLDMGLAHGDYAAQFPASGTPDVQAALVAESMQYVISRTKMRVIRA